MPPAKRSSKGPGQGIRIWHRRVFSSRKQCRQRHGRCDETSSYCRNCTHMRLVCDGYAQNVVFLGRDQIPRTAQNRIKPQQPSQIYLHRQDRSPPSAGNSPSVSGLQMRNYAIATPSTSTLCPETRYSSHFRGTVSSLLIVIHTSHNSNPYRLSFPQLAESAGH